jgi:uncharacterized protein (TIGR02453 family)
MLFSGFSREALSFLADLATHNDRAWFAAHKETCQQMLLAPAQQFVEVLGEQLRGLVPEIQVDTRTDGRGNLMRLARDTRFSADKSPYKTALSSLFWVGNEKTRSPAFGFRLCAHGMDLMAGMFTFTPTVLQAFRAAVDDDQTGAELDRVRRELEAQGYGVQGQHYRRVPAGYDPHHPRAALLRHNALYLHPPVLTPDVVCSPQLVDVCLEHFTAMVPVYQWLVAALRSADDAGQLPTEGGW